MVTGLKECSMRETVRTPSSCLRTWPMRLSSRANSQSGQARNGVPVKGTVRGLLGRYRASNFSVSNDTR
jgi:hypothetical protein